VYRRLALYAEVGFNAIIHYVHYREPSGKTPNAPLSLHRYKLRGYYQYWAIPIYMRFYSAYVKSAERTLYS